MSHRGGFQGGGMGQRDKGENWICPSCDNDNWPSRSVCKRCNAQKPVPKRKHGATTVGKEASVRSGGLFSADDWICLKCGNTNWASRPLCNLCKQPRNPVVEDRKGLGGGFKEREEVIEYKEHNSDDDEYDDFGRLKKKRRTGHRAVSPPHRPRDPTDRYSSEKTREREERDKEDSSSKKKEATTGAADDDDEDDDDDDDGDVAAYVLDDGDDNAEAEDDGDDADVSAYAI